MAAYRRVYDSRHQTANLADLYFKQALQFPKPKTKGKGKGKRSVAAANLTTAPSGQRSCYATALATNFLLASPDFIHRTGFACRSVDGVVQEMQVVCWTQANQLAD